MKIGMQSPPCEYGNSKAQPGHPTPGGPRHRELRTGLNAVGARTAAVYPVCAGDAGDIHRNVAFANEICLKRAQPMAGMHNECGKYHKSGQPRSSKTSRASPTEIGKSLR